MKKYHLCALALVFTQLSFGYASAVWAKADCELKQLVTADEFKMLQEKMKVNSLLSIAEKDYLQLKPSDEIYFYDTKSSNYKAQEVILRWRKKDSKFTIKDRSVGVIQKNAECQSDYTSKNKQAKSCQFDNNSPGHLPQQIQLSEDQKLFLDSRKFKWYPSELVTLGPIYSYKAKADRLICKGLEGNEPFEFETWLMKNSKKHSQLLFEISTKVDGKKCVSANIAFRDCIHKLGINVDSDRGTKTEAIYTFFGN